MKNHAGQVYQERLTRYVTAMRNGKPDKIPIRPFVAEFTARYAGFTCQDVTHDFTKAFLAVRRCAADFDWDAVVANMVYVWTGLTEAIGLKYYGVPGIDVPADTGFQYREPDEEHAFMKADEYDQLIDDPTAFLYTVWLPRVSADVRSPGQPATYRNALALVKGGMAMLNYFSAFGPQCDLLKKETGTVPAIAGILKAPFDILADKLRGYVGLTMDMLTQPGKVLKACEALMPHLYHVALETSDPEKLVPIGYWMHRGCVPFVAQEWFDSHYWPTVKPIIENLWKDGHQTLCYAEGDWSQHLDAFYQLPETSIVYHVDKGNIADVHRALGHKFCLSGGIRNDILAYGTADDVRRCCKGVIDAVAQDGGYIMDASAIMQNDTRPENLRALTDFTREYGIYSAGSASSFPKFGGDSSPGGSNRAGMPCDQRVKPGQCVPWEEKCKERPATLGDEKLARRVWEDVDALGHMFVWQCLVSF